MGNDVPGLSAHVKSLAAIYTRGSTFQRDASRVGNDVGFGVVK